MDQIFFILAIIISAIMHEYAHAWMADFLGDPTPRYAGRLTINPLPHIDVFGTILMPLFLYIGSGGSFLFAYAKPVPYNPYNLRAKKYGSSLVAVAGPGANLAMALAFGTFVRFAPFSPLAPFLGTMVYVNILLAVFNLIPIPPLDGSKVLFDFLPHSMSRIRFFLERYGFIFLLFFVFFAFRLIFPAISLLFRVMTGYPL